jgi:2-dehydropantoate 2-reductase
MLCNGGDAEGGRAMRVAIMGSGGVGAYVGARLQAAGEQVAFIARGAHLAALRSGGLRIEHPQHPLQLPEVQATDTPADIGPVDLVIFAVKLWDTETAARQLAPLVGDRTRVLTLQNGIDSVALIGRHVDPGRVRGGVIYLSAVIGAPGVIRSPGGMHQIIADAARADPVMAAFAAAGARCEGLGVALSDAVERVVWEKFVALSSLSAATALLRASIGPILANPETRALQRQLVDEAIAVASACGQVMRDGLADELMAKMAGMPPRLRASMAEDLERGGRLELDWLSGRLHALGQQSGVPTPAHSTAYRALVLHKDGRSAGA